jgi:hypothetical protein
MRPGANGGVYHTADRGEERSTNTPECHRDTEGETARKEKCCEEDATEIRRKRKLGGKKNREEKNGRKENWGGTGLIREGSRGDLDWSGSGALSY